MNFNPADIMKNMQNMQSQMKDMQTKLKFIKAIGLSGGGLVKVEINGELKVENISIDPVAVDPRDISMLQDLIIAAFNSAQENIKEKIQNEMGSISNLPFDLSGLK